MKTQQDMIQTDSLRWVAICPSHAIPENGGAAAMVEGKQYAIFNFARMGKWYATDNMCPHKMQMAIARGIIGGNQDEPKVACPFHKKTFSLETGQCLSGEDYSIQTYPVKLVDDMVYLGLG